MVGSLRRVGEAFFSKKHHKKLPGYLFWTFLFAALVILVEGPASVTAQSDREPPSTTAAASSHRYRFQDELNFAIQFVNDPPMGQVTLYLNAPHFRNSYRAEFQIEADTGSYVEFNHVIDLSTVSIDPFATLSYWWTLETEAGDLYEIKPVSFVYFDDRFEWESKAGEGYVVSWTTGQGEIGQIAVEIIEETLPVLESFYNLKLNKTPEIFIYPSVASMQTIYGSDWVGGVANPAGGRVLIPAGNPRTAVLDFRRQLPHELSHLFFAETVKNNPDRGPKWLDEGLAVYFENPPNSSYEPVLQKALNDQTTIPFELLCANFPTQSTDLILLAYAQSGSMVRYLEQTFGRDQLTNLLTAVQDGVTCQQVVEQQFGLSLSQLEEQWLASSNLTPDEPTFTFSDPDIFWMILIFAAFGLIGILAIGSIREA